LTSSRAHGELLYYRSFIPCTPGSPASPLPPSHTHTHTHTHTIFFYSPPYHPFSHRFFIHHVSLAFSLSLLRSVVAADYQRSTDISIHRRLPREESAVAAAAAAAVQLDARREGERNWRKSQHIGVRHKRIDVYVAAVISEKKRGVCWFDATAMPVPHRHAPDVKKYFGRYSGTSTEEAILELRRVVGGTEVRRLIARWVNEREICSLEFFLSIFY